MEVNSLQELIQPLKKYFILIISLTILSTLIVGLVSYFYLTPVYQASIKLLVQENTASPNSGEIQKNIQLINTYNVIIKDPAILDIVRNELSIEQITTEALISKINVSGDGNSQVVTITVQDQNQFVARDIANTTATVFQREISNIMNVDNVNLLSKAKATENQAPIKPDKIKFMAIAMVVGLMIGVGLALLLDYLDNTLNSEQEIESLLGIPVIGSISSMEKKEQVKLDKVQQKLQLEGEHSNG
ncbi:YveK family protein [Paenisporosarcina sp. TG-14]|uniref:YveK family protein n=1 Tax=Paenisporosarcina sp. TG-14 TaxID=1231057 RepID=UPI0002DD18E9|nr:Wzz/FepE/Etk N-terminal domain-containing protein [Paenisporosarcina sp. TG-14]